MEASGELRAHNQAHYSQNSSDIEMSKNGSACIVVPVDPTLCRAMDNLLRIDEYRLTGDALLLDELMAD